VSSPLLSNLYMRRFVLGWKKLGHEKRLKAYIINYADDNYADDLVICCHARADEALVMMRNMVSRLKLTVNENKTRACRLAGEKFDFLGYTFGSMLLAEDGVGPIGTPVHLRDESLSVICASGSFFNLFQIGEAESVGAFGDHRGGGQPQTRPTDQRQPRRVVQLWRTRLDSPARPFPEGWRFPSDRQTSGPADSWRTARARLCTAQSYGGTLG
jgi:hypothetical protein